MNAFKEVVELIGWLAGAVAGFSGAVYVAGYLIIQTNRHLLGFDAPLTYNAEAYLREGGSFALDAGMTTAHIVMSLTLVVALALFVFILLSFPAAMLFYPFKRRHVKDAIYRIGTRWIKMTERTSWVWRTPLFWLLLLRKRLFRTLKRRSWVWRGPVFALLVLLFALHPLSELEWVQATLDVSDLASAEPAKYKTDDNPDAQCKKTAEYKRCMIANPDKECRNNNAYRKCLLTTRLVKRGKSDTDWLDARFEATLLATLVSGLLVFLAWRTLSLLRLRYLLTLPFVLTFVIYIAFLPMIYGVLKSQLEFSPVEIRFLDDNRSREAGNLFLLDITETEFILWNADNKLILMVSKDAVLAAEIKQRRFLFQPAQE